MIMSVFVDIVVTTDSLFAGITTTYCGRIPVFKGHLLSNAKQWTSVLFSAHLMDQIVLVNVYFDEFDFI